MNRASMLVVNLFLDAYFFLRILSGESWISTKC